MQFFHNVSNVTENEGSAFGQHVSSLYKPLIQIYNSTGVFPPMAGSIYKTIILGIIRSSSEDQNHCL